MSDKNSTKIIRVTTSLFISLISIAVFIIKVILGFDFYSGIFIGFNVEYLKYFTSLSNFYNGIIFTIIAIYSIIHYRDEKLVYPKYMKILALSATSGVAITFFITIFFLNFSLPNPRILYEYEILFFHIINPIISILFYVLYMRGPTLIKREAFLGGIPLFTYSIFYSIFVISGVWTDFYNFTFGGSYWIVFIAFPVVVGISLGINLLLILLNQKVIKE